MFCSPSPSGIVSLSESDTMGCFVCFCAVVSGWMFLFRSIKLGCDVLGIRHVRQGILIPSIFPVRSQKWTVLGRIPRNSGPSLGFNICEFSSISNVTIPSSNPFFLGFIKHHECYKDAGKCWRFLGFGGYQCCIFVWSDCCKVWQITFRSRKVTSNFYYREICSNSSKCRSNLRTKCIALCGIYNTLFLKNSAL